MFMNVLAITAMICGGAMIGVIESGTPTGILYKLIAMLALAGGGYMLGVG